MYNESNIVYILSRLCVDLFVPFFFRVHITGRANIPREGGALFCSNHQSYLDPVLAGHSSFRPLRYMAKSELFRFRPFGMFISQLGAFPVQREGNAMGAVKKAIKLIRQGQVVLMFVEGTRGTGDRIGEIKSGAALVASRAECPIIPAFIKGSWRAWPRHRNSIRPAAIHISIGAPLYVSKRKRSEADKVSFDKLPDRLESEFRMLRDMRTR